MINILIHFPASMFDCTVDKRLNLASKKFIRIKRYTLAVTKVGSFSWYTTIIKLNPFNTPWLFEDPDHFQELF